LLPPLPSINTRAGPQAAVTGCRRLLWLLWWWLGLSALVRAAKGAIDERNFAALRAAQERKIRSAQATALQQQETENKTRGSAARAKAAREGSEAQAKAAALRAKDLEVEDRRQQLRVGVTSPLTLGPSAAFEAHVLMRKAFAGSLLSLRVCCCLW
jgi:hypothetical protein